MATNFVDAVKEHTERLKKTRAAQPDYDEIVRVVLEAAHPVIVGIVKRNNVEVVRVVRNNPELIRRN